MLNSNDTVLIVVDVQEKLIGAMHNREKLVENFTRLIKGAQVLEVPIIITEQNPRGLGATIPQLASLFSEFNPIPKLSFSCCSDKKFADALKKSKRKQVLLTGIETHVCIYQTAVDLLSSGYKVQIVADCVSSRTPENINIALDRIKSEGAKITSIEMALFELLRVAEGDKFKKILQIVK